AGRRAREPAAEHGGRPPQRTGRACGGAAAAAHRGPDPRHPDLPRSAGAVAAPVHLKGMNDMTTTFRIAAIPGDGIGKEVLPEGLRVLHAAAARFGFAL